MNAAESQANAVCPQCGDSTRPGARFCGTCGRAVNAAPDASSTAAGRPPPLPAPPAPKAPPLANLLPPTSLPVVPDGATAGFKAGASRLLSRLLALFGVAMNPGALLKSRLESCGWPWALAVSGTAFLLFFLQTGLDLARAGHAEARTTAALAVTGMVYGTLGVALIGAVAWMLARLMGGESRPVGWVIRAFGLGYSPALIYGVFGISANLLLGWNTAVAFGITGALWALGPMTATVKEMVNNKPWVSAALASFCGGLLLFGWAWLGQLSS